MKRCPEGMSRIRDQNRDRKHGPHNQNYKTNNAIPLILPTSSVMVTTAVLDVQEEGMKESHGGRMKLGRGWEQTVEDDIHEIVEAGLGEMVGDAKDSDIDKTVQEIKFKVAVRTALFNRMKFIGKDSDLDVCGSAYNCMVKKLTLVKETGESTVPYWNYHRHLVRETLNNKRGTVNQLMKLAFMGKSTRRLRVIYSATLKNFSSMKHCRAVSVWKVTRQGGYDGSKEEH